MRVLASPFDYDTGFFFKGEHSFNCMPLGAVTAIGILFLFSSFLVLFGPVILQTDVESDLQVVPFTIPADVPDEELMPSYLAQLFGRQVPRKKPDLNLDDFNDQFYRVDVYGPTTCNSAKFECTAG